MKKFYLISLILLLPFTAVAQQAETAEGEPVAKHRKFVPSDETRGKFDISTNLFDWADLGTVNLDFAYSVSRHITLQAGVKYNGWQFENDSRIPLVQNQQKTASLGFRFWPWYVYSGWWFCIKAQYSDFFESGFCDFYRKCTWTPAFDKGKAVGGSFSLGYTLMVSKHFNVEFGAGVWGGKLLEQEVYECKNCYDNGVLLESESGPRNFIAVNDLNISLHWLF